MGFKHSKDEPEEYGHSPGNGVTHIPLSRRPMATEGEATPGPDDVNPFDQREFEEAKETHADRHMPEFKERDPTAGDDPFVFDDVDDEVDRVDLPEPGPMNLDLDFL